MSIHEGNESHDDEVPGVYIDAVLDRLISEAIDHTVEGNPHDAVVTLTAARQRAEAWGASVVPRDLSTREGEGI